MNSQIWTVAQKLKDNINVTYSTASKHIADTSSSTVVHNDRTGLFIALFLSLLLLILILYLLYNFFSYRSLCNTCRKSERINKKVTDNNNNASIHDHLQNQHLEDDSFIDNIDNTTPTLSKRYSQSSSIRSYNRQNSYKISPQASNLLTPRLSQILTTAGGDDSNTDIDSCIKTLLSNQELEPYSAKLLSRSISKYYENKRKLTRCTSLTRRSRSCEQLNAFNELNSRKSLTIINHPQHHRRVLSERPKGYRKREYLAPKDASRLSAVEHDFSTVPTLRNNAGLWKSEHLSKKDSNTTMTSSIKRKPRRTSQPQIVSHHQRQHSLSDKQKPTTIYELFRSDKMRIANLL
ncbi:unnamed protein product [Didymodactylos carnosus]|uniref:Uncharacterized protein n=1 Tax=Didymodactylos carnosus TaxID=1234261 RepID=A0A813TYG8_9BILA|nr:unnamed protein product [Didymodactylos carnosus]CAF0874921.1 unnamed protein product [Didymodactylos carnosus]CAF3607596.1 unnamed protein product [Didymodactylos carnosus]CAF3659452.1 unnamed protein product [Didymodactylos carnosus]